MKFDSMAFIQEIQYLERWINDLQKTIDEFYKIPEEERYKEEGAVKTPVELLELQKAAMEQYFKLLKLRAKEFEHIEIPD